MQADTDMNAIIVTILKGFVNFGKFILNENIPVYGLFKSTIEVAEKLVFEGITLSKNKAIIKNKENMLMHDLCSKLEDCVDREKDEQLKSELILVVEKLKKVSEEN